MILVQHTNEVGSFCSKWSIEAMLCTCKQDYYYSQHSEWSKDKVVFIRHLLNTVLNTDVSVINFGLQKLEWLAGARFTIDIVASWMKDFFIDDVSALWACP
jgi:hypothetical protein